MSLLNKLVLPVLLVIVLTANGVLTITGWQAPSIMHENRTLAARPQWSGDLNAYIRGLDMWLADNFAFRKPMVSAFNEVLYSVFRSTFTPNILIGSGPWIFGAAFDEQPSLAPRELAPEYLAKVKQTLIDRKAWLKARGIEMFVMLIPSKEAIYGNRFLPERWHVDARHKTESEQVYDVLKDVMPENIVPLRQAMFEESEKHELYFHTDPHATQYGTFVAYQQLAERINRFFPEKAPSPYPPFTLQADVYTPTAYGILMGIPFRDYSFVPVPNGGYKAVAYDDIPHAELIPKGARVTSLRNDHVRDIRAVLVGDSFTNRMINIFGEVFSESVVMNMNNTENRPEEKFPYAFLDAYRPDLVVMLFVETRLLDCPDGCGQFPAEHPKDLH